jgi:tRNA dimethylallyltransferase
LVEHRERRFFVIGPTASGKGRLAAEIARRVGGEVISVDSMKVYRGMDIGTAKPDLAARRGVPFHLLDVRDPGDPMSVAQWIDEAAAAEREVRARGRVPIFAGGTALYVRALTEGVFEGPAADWELRRALALYADENGVLALHARLAAIDPKTAARLHPNDRRRVIRALEVHQKTGRPISELQTQWATAAFGGAPAPAGARTLVGLFWPREVLYERIDERVERMFARGFLEEARRLLALPGGIGREAAQALGYRELFAWIRSGEKEPLAAIVAAVKRHTRRFSRRQMTFFRRFPDVDWRPVDRATDVEALAERLANEYRDVLGR